MNFTGISGQNDRKVSPLFQIHNHKENANHTQWIQFMWPEVNNGNCLWLKNFEHVLFGPGWLWRRKSLHFFFSVVNLWNNLTIYFQSCFKALLFLFFRFVTRYLSICSWKNFLAIIQTMVTWWYGFQSFLASRWQFWLMSMIIISLTNSSLTSRVSTFWC